MENKQVDVEVGYRCDECDRIYKHLTNLRRHERLAHEVLYAPRAIQIAARKNVIYERKSRIQESAELRRNPTRNANVPEEPIETESLETSSPPSPVQVPVPVQTQPPVPILAFGMGPNPNPSPVPDCVMGLGAPTMVPAPRVYYSNSQAIWVAEQVITRNQQGLRMRMSDNVVFQPIGGPKSILRPWASIN